MQQPPPPPPPPEPGRSTSRRTMLVAGMGGLAGLSLSACSSSSPGTAAAGAAGSAPPSGSTAPGQSGSGLPGSGQSGSGPAGAGQSGSGQSGSGQSGSATSPGAGSAAGGGAPRPGPDITHGPRTRKAVALTFHGAGDPAIVRDMLAAVRTAGARITVLAIGQWLAGDPALAAMIRDGGHELGNHTWSHQTMPRLNAAQVRSEVDRAAEVLQRITGTPGRWFRPSGTPTSTPAIRAAAVAAGYGACLAYDVDPLDYTDPGPDAVASRFAAAVQPGSIVSLHLGHPGTLRAMPALLRTLQARGLAAVTVSELLA